MVRYLDDKTSGFGAFAAAKDAAKPGKVHTFLYWIMLAALAWLLASWLFPSTPKTPAVTQNAEIAAVQGEDQYGFPGYSVYDGKVEYAFRGGLRITKIKLQDYAEKQGADKRIELLAGDKEFIEIGILANGTAAPNVMTDWKLYPGSQDGAKLSFRNSDGVEFFRRIVVTDYTFEIRDEIRNTTKRDFSVTPYVRIVRHAGADVGTVSTGGVVFENGSIDRESWKSVGKKSYVWNSPMGFVGFEDQYWQTIAKIDSADQTMRLKPLADGRLQAETSAAAVSVPAGQTVVLTTNIFTGPKTLDAVKDASAVIPGIEQTIDYGWFWFLTRPFLWAINSLHAIVGNYGVAIILLTIILRLLMWPLTRKSYTSMAGMQKMQPEMMKIQKQYAGDKMRLQQEMMKLYQTHKTSPMSGCLPMLLQIPIFFALYKTLLISVPMRQANFLWIMDLSAMDPYFILPVLMGATMWWQQRISTPKTGLPSAPGMGFMKWLPLVFTAMFAWMPAGLVLYWTVSNIFGIAQIKIIKK